MRREGLLATLVISAVLFLPQAVLSSPAGGLPVGPAPLQDDAAAAGAVVNQVAAAAYGGDYEKYISLYTDDAALMQAGGPVVLGKAAIRARDRAFAPEAGEWVNTVEDVHLDGDTAVVRTSYREWWTANGTKTSVVGKEVWVLERQSDGSWLVSLFIWNLDQPAERTPAASE